jgi:hypothetical protein
MAWPTPQLLKYEDRTFPKFKTLEKLLQHD